MGLGTAGALVSILGTFFVTVWRIKAEQGALRQEVESRLTKVETDVGWVVNQTRERQKVMQDYYLDRHRLDDEKSND